MNFNDHKCYYAFVLIYIVYSVSIRYSSKLSTVRVIQ